jgi:inorganic pyrophosphatase
MTDFWAKLESLVADHKLVLDRPRGSHHPRYQEVIYPIDYGYLEGTSGGDVNEVDVWRGSMPEGRAVGIVCTVDSLKGDTEVKLLLGCTAAEIETISSFLNNGYMSAIVIERR